MKIYAIAIGAGLGYLAGNAQARRKTAEVFKQVKSSPTAKAVEDRVSSKVTELTSKKDREIDMSDTAFESGISDPSYVGGADSVDPSAFGQPSSSRSSMVSP
jgi:hypothetical protein